MTTNTSSDKQNYVDSNSEAFKQQMQVLGFLKDPEGDISITKSNPKICLTCWVIFTDADAKHHTQSGGHVTTGTFASMQKASDQMVVSLCKAKDRFSKDERSDKMHVQLFEFSKALKEKLESVEKFSFLRKP